jgi:hypothetical protein
MSKIQAIQKTILDLVVKQKYKGFTVAGNFSYMRSKQVGDTLEKTR